MKRHDITVWIIGVLVAVLCAGMFACEKSRAEQRVEQRHQDDKPADLPAPKNEAEADENLTTLKQRLKDNEKENGELKKAIKLAEQDKKDLHDAHVMARAAWVAGLLGLAAVACGVLAFVVPEQARRFVMGAVGCGAMGVVVLAYRQVVPYQVEIGWGVAGLALVATAYWLIHLRKTADHGVGFGDAVVGAVQDELSKLRGNDVTPQVAAVIDGVAKRIEVVKDNHATQQTIAGVRKTIDKLRKKAG
jgi:hypothetical protein